MSKELGIRLYYFRTHKAECSQRQIADLLGVERSTYTKYETGVSEPSLSSLIKLKHFFGVSYEELLESTPGDTDLADYDLDKHQKSTSG